MNIFFSSFLLKTLISMTKKELIGGSLYSIYFIIHQDLMLFDSLTKYIIDLTNNRT